MGGVAGLAAGEGGRGREGVVVVGGGDCVGVGVVRVLPKPGQSVMYAELDPFKLDDK